RGIGPPDGHGSTERPSTFADHDARRPARLRRSAGSGQGLFYLGGETQNRTRTGDAEGQRARPGHSVGKVAVTLRVPAKNRIDDCTGGYFMRRISFLALA